MAEHMDTPEGAKDELHKVGEVVEVIQEGDIVEIVEIEVYGRENKKPPHARKYHIRIDKQPKVVDKRYIDGKELLGLVDKSPEQWRLFQKLHGGHMEEIEPHQTVDLGKQGVERFTTMEKAQRPGEQSATAAESQAKPAPRRQFRLPGEDEAYLDSLGLCWEAIIEEKVRWVLIHEHPVPAGYNHSTVTLAVRIEPAYPPAALDMAYVFPSLARSDRKAIDRVTAQAIDGNSYQCWSRHYDWREGVDDFAMHHLRAKNWMAAEISK